MFGRLRGRDVVRAREPASFWRENAVAVVIQLRILASLSGGTKLSNVRIFIICARERA